MHYIVMDLEWNQPLSYASMPFKRVGDKLMFEMIQIGAVKLDENRRFVGSFNRFIRPAHYQKLHPRIRRITGISQDDLSASPAFRDAMAQFLAWCGDDYVLLTWGCDDISILAQNMAFFKVENSLPPVYDLQLLFSRLTLSGANRHSLRKAMAHYGISASADHPFHSAVDDAYYTALVFQKCPDAKEVTAFPETPKLLGTAGEKASKKAAERRVKSIAGGLRTNTAKYPPCPVCGRKTQPPEGYVAQKEEGVYLALADCKQHGLLYAELSFIREAGGCYKMSSRVWLSDEQNPAYVRTKHLQWANKVAHAKQHKMEGK